MSDLEFMVSSLYKFDLVRDISSGIKVAEALVAKRKPWIGVVKNSSVFLWVPGMKKLNFWFSYWCVVSMRGFGKLGMFITSIAKVGYWV